MFVQAADGLMQGLDSTVEGIRKTLELSLACLAHKVITSSRIPTNIDNHLMFSYFTDRGFIFGPLGWQDAPRRSQTGVDKY